MINTRFWIDDYIADLDPTEKLLFLYFLTNPYTDICGVYEVPLKHVALETGIDKEMVIKILGRFEKDGKIFYQNGWVAMVNFAKHQLKNPKVEQGIKLGLAKAPKELLDRLSIDYDRLSHLNSNSNSNPNSNPKNTGAEAPEVFDLKKEIAILEDSPRRDLQIIGLYLKQRKVDIRSKLQLSGAIKRHARAAKELKSFDDDQIIRGFRRAAEQTAGWTIETAVKMVTK